MTADLQPLPPPDLRFRRLQLSLCVTGILLTLSYLALPLIGASLTMQKYGDLIPARVVAEMWLMNLAGPVFLLLLWGPGVYCFIKRKRLPMWIVFFGLLGVFGNREAGGDYAHDFSHLIFDSCTAYRNYVFWQGLFIALAFGLVWILNYMDVRGCRFSGNSLRDGAALVRDAVAFVRHPGSRITRRIIAGVALLLVWAGTLRFLEII